MSMPLSYLYYIRRDICLNDEQRVLVSTHVQSLSLADRIELRSIVLSHNLSERIFLVTGLLDVLSAAAVCLCLELDVLRYRLRQSHEIRIGKACNLVYIERTLPFRSGNSLILRDIVRNHLDI